MDIQVKRAYLVYSYVSGRKDIIKEGKQEK